MKQFIVLIGMIGLGLFIFGLILGPGDGSIVHFMGGMLSGAMGQGMS